MKNLLATLKKDPKKMAIVIIAAALVVLFAYINLLLKPQVAGLFRTMAQARKVSAELKGAKADIARIDQMKANIALYDAKVGRYEKVLPTEEGIPTLLESLSEMARNSNMKIVGIVPGSESTIQRGQTYHEIPIMVAAKSGYHELGRFFGALENSDRFMKIADLQIKASPATPKKHDIDLLILTYVLLEGK